MRGRLGSRREGTFWGLWLGLLVAGTPAERGLVEVWRDDTFADFAAGTVGAAGANLYVSSTGWVQTIHRWDFNGDGHLDLLFNQTHDVALRLPASVYAGGRQGISPRPVLRLPTEGGRFALTEDINGDGFTDVLIVNGANGTHERTGAFLYWVGPRSLYGAHPRPVFVGSLVRVAALGRFHPEGLAPMGRSRESVLGAFALGHEGRLVFVLSFSPRPVIAATKIVGVTSVAVSGGFVFVLRSGHVYRLRLGEHGQIRESLPLPGPEREHLWLARVDENETPDLICGRHSCPLQWLKDGDPREPVRDLPVTTPRAIALADFDRDGHPDLTAAMADAVLVFPSVAGGGRPSVPLPASWASALTVGDWNADGWPDPAVAIERTHEQYETMSAVYWRALEGLSPSRRTLFPSSGARDVASGDFTGDGIEDLLIVNGIRGRLRGDIPSLLYWGGGRSGFRSDRVLRLPTVGAYESSATDLNEDGYVDLIIVCAYEDDAEGDRGAMIFWGTPSGPDIARPAYLPTHGAISSSVADLSRDGDPDLVFSEFRTGDVKIFWGGPPGYEHAPATAPHRDPRFHLIADLNGDGWLDIFVPDVQQKTSLLYWGGPKGFHPDRVAVISGFGTTAAEAADLDGGSWLDLILCSFWDPDTRNYHVPSLILWGGPHGYDPSRRSELEAWGCHDVAVADLNKDGSLDIAFSNYHAGSTRHVKSFIYWGGRHGYRSHWRTGLPNGSAAGLQIGDFNEDGWLDITFSNHMRADDHRAHSRIYWGGPRGFDRHRVSWLPTTGPHQMATTDPGNLLDRRPREIFTSRIIRPRSSLRPLLLTWRAEQPPGTTLRFQIRAGTTPEALHRAPWWGPRGAQTFFTGSPARLDGLPLSGPYVQYRAWFDANPAGSAPHLDRVEIVFAEPHGGHTETFRRGKLLLWRKR